MPLIRRDPPAPSGDGPPSSSDLMSADPEARRRAVRSLVHDGRAVPVLMDTLERESDPAVLEAIFSTLETIPEAAFPLASLLRSDDAALRNDAVEALQAMPDAARPLLPGLLADPDADVRFLSVEVARCLPAGEMVSLMCGLLTRESDPNVCSAAVEILAEAGTADAVPALRRLAERFQSEPMLSFAVRVAIERIAGARN